MGILRKKSSKISLKSSKSKEDRPVTPPPQLPPLPGHIASSTPSHDSATAPAGHQRQRSRSLWSSSEEAVAASQFRKATQGSAGDLATPSQPWRSREAWAALHSPTTSFSPSPQLALPGPSGDLPGWRSRAGLGGFFGTAPDSPRAKRLSTSPSVPNLQRHLNFDDLPPMPPIPAGLGNANSSLSTGRRRSPSSPQTNTGADYATPARAWSPTVGMNRLETPETPSQLVTPNASLLPALIPDDQQSPSASTSVGTGSSGNEPLLVRNDSVSTNESLPVPMHVTPSRPKRALPPVPPLTHSEDGHEPQYAGDMSHRSSLPETLDQSDNESNEVIDFTQPSPEPPMMAGPAQMVDRLQHPNAIPAVVTSDAAHAVPLHPEPSLRSPSRQASNSSYTSFHTSRSSRSHSSSGHHSNGQHTDREYSHIPPPNPVGVASTVNLWRTKHDSGEAQTPFLPPRSSSRANVTSPSVIPWGSRRTSRKTETKPIPTVIGSDIVYDDPLGADPFAPVGAWEAEHTYSVYDGATFEASRTPSVKSAASPPPTSPAYRAPIRLPRMSGGQPQMQKTSAHPPAPAHMARVPQGGWI